MSLFRHADAPWEAPNVLRESIAWGARKMNVRARHFLMGAEFDAVEFDWPADRSVRIEIDHPSYFPVGTEFVKADPSPTPCVMLEVFAHEPGNVLRCVTTAEEYRDRRGTICDDYRFIPGRYLPRSA